MGQEIVRYSPDTQAVTADIARTIDVQAMTNAMENFHRFVKSVLKEGVHYGKVPKVPKPFLWQPGAEEIFRAFNCRPEYSTVQEQQDPLMGYAMIWRKCRAIQLDTDMCVGEADAICVSTEFTKRNGDPLPWHDTLPKTVMMADKRAFVKCARTLGCASEIFTQDEDAVLRSMDGQAETDEPAGERMEFERGNGWERRGDRYFIDCPKHGKGSYAKMWPANNRGPANVSCSKKLDDGTYCKHRVVLAPDVAEAPKPDPRVRTVLEAMKRGEFTGENLDAALGMPENGMAALRQWFLDGNGRTAEELIDLAKAAAYAEPEYVEGEIADDDLPF